MLGSRDGGLVSCIVRVMFFWFVSWCRLVDEMVEAGWSVGLICGNVVSWSFGSLIE